jgi:hypothetical protein
MYILHLPLFEGRETRNCQTKIFFAPLISSSVSGLICVFEDSISIQSHLVQKCTIAQALGKGKAVRVTHCETSKPQRSLDIFFQSSYSEISTRLTKSIWLYYTQSCVQSGKFSCLKYDSGAFISIVTVIINILVLVYI